MRRIALPLASPGKILRGRRQAARPDGVSVTAMAPRSAFDLWQAEVAADLSTEGVLQFGVPGHRGARTRGGVHVDVVALAMATELTACALEPAEELPALHPETWTRLRRPRRRPLPLVASR